MKTSQQGKEFIKSFESLQLKAYKCSAGVPTIGYGHTKGVTMDMVIDESEANKLLDEDVAQFDLDLNKKLPKKVRQNQWDALISFIFNLGMGAFLGSTLYKKLKADPEDPTIPNEFLKWDKARVNGELVALKGLTRRRAAEAMMYKQNIYTT